MNEASQFPESTQPKSPEQAQTERATELAEKVRVLAARRAEIAAQIDEGKATEDVRENLADLDHVLLGARADLIQQEGTAGAKPENE